MRVAKWARGTIAITIFGFLLGPLGAQLAMAQDNTTEKGHTVFLATDDEVEFKGDWSQPDRTREFVVGAGGGQFVVKHPNRTPSEEWYPSEGSDFAMGQKVVLAFAFAPQLNGFPPLSPPGEGEGTRKSKKTAYTLKTIALNDRVEWEGDWSMIGSATCFYAGADGGHLVIKNERGATKQRYPSDGEFPEGYWVGVTVGVTHTVLGFLPYGSAKDR